MAATSASARADSPYPRLGVRRVINARGCATLAGGTLMSPEVLAAYQAGAGAFALIDELQQAAGRRIATITGAEAGYVTSGAAAGIVLATAACLAGLDVHEMERLPKATGVRKRVLMPRSHRNGYEWSLQAAGAQLAFFDGAGGAPELRSAIDSCTAAVFFVADREVPQLTLATTVEVAHAAGLPVVVDAALALPPVSNLRRLVATGADLVVFSGGKSIRGPQASGFIAGRADLALSVALQHQDMDVRAETWSRRQLVASKQLARPPHNGLGRGMKVGKEEIVALLAALEEYVGRDHKADQRRWRELARQLAGRLNAVAGLTVRVRERDPSGRPVPSVELVVDRELVGRTADQLTVALLERDPIILLDDAAGGEGRLRLDVENLLDAELDELVSAVADAANGGVARTPVGVT
ncbi:MAG TPA: L-seryl-tRNA selenium transferase [Candidatus Dormibacteraeota bacterium]|nr:L-seryl-tRNA selenium transferase [Candidatus Dormibacteraeota bacterium]